MENLNDAILSEQVLTNTQVGSNAFHVAFGVDAHYIKAMGTTILSILKNNRNTEFIFHVFYSSIMPDDLDRLSQLVIDQRITVHLYHIDPNFFKGYPTFAQFSSAIYNRLLVVTKLRGIANKVLYLDADIVCLADLSEIFQLNMDNQIISAVRASELVVSRQTKKLNIMDNDYFFSGVMYIDVDRWNENDISDKAMQLILDNFDKYTFPDQDALNVALHGRVLFLDQKWNFVCDLDKDTVPADTILLHYAGRTKPWSEWCLYPVRNYFLKYYMESPWREVAFDKPTHYKHMKAYFKACRRNGDFLRSLYWYFRYLHARCKK